MAKDKKSNLPKILGFIVVFIVVLVLGRNILIKNMAQAGVKAVTGLPMKIDKFNIGLTSSVIEIQGFKLFNPDGFSEKVMMDIPEIYIDYKFGTILTGKVHLEEIRFHLKDFIVVKKADGTSNLDFLKALQDAGASKEKPKEEKKEPAKKKEVQIDNLTLKVDQAQTIVYKADGEPATKTFKIGLNEEHKDIKSMNAVILWIVFKIALKAPAVATAGNIDMGILGDVMSGTLGKATELLGVGTGAAGEVLGGAKGALSETTGKLKGLLGK